MLQGSALPSRASEAGSLNLLTPQIGRLPDARRPRPTRRQTTGRPKLILRTSPESRDQHRGSTGRLGLTGAASGREGRMTATEPMPSIWWITPPARGWSVGRHDRQARSSGPGARFNEGQIGGVKRWAGAVGRVRCQLGDLTGGSPAGGPVAAPTREPGPASLPVRGSARGSPSASCSVTTRPARQVCRSRAMADPSCSARP